MSFDISDFKHLKSFSGMYRVPLDNNKTQYFTEAGLRKYLQQGDTTSMSSSRVYNKVRSRSESASRVKEFSSRSLIPLKNKYKPVFLFEDMIVGDAYKNLLQTGVKKNDQGSTRSLSREEVMNGFRKRIEPSLSRLNRNGNRGSSSDNFPNSHVSTSQDVSMYGSQNTKQGTNIYNKFTLNSGCNAIVKNTKNDVSIVEIAGYPVILNTNNNVTTNKVRSVTKHRSNNNYIVPKSGFLKTIKKDIEPYEDIVSYNKERDSREKKENLAKNFCKKEEIKKIKDADSFFEDVDDVVEIKNLVEAIETKVSSAKNPSNSLRSSINSMSFLK